MLEHLLIALSHIELHIGISIAKNNNQTILPKHRRRISNEFVFNNISALSWRSVLLVEETGGQGENQLNFLCTSLSKNKVIIKTT
jgi:hypothetical protein